MDIDELLEYGAILMMQLLLIRRRRRQPDRWRYRRWWVRPINRNRPLEGDHTNLFQELKEDVTMFLRYTRMDVPTFYDLLNIVHPYLIKYHYRALCTELRLAITLRYLASGDQIISIALAYRIGESTARNIIKEVCEVLARVLQPDYLKKPTEEEWRNIASRFLEQWNFPNCMGAIDGKHFLIQAPANSGSLFFNYKKTFSIVLLAICDSNYKFTLVQVGDMGSNSDAGIFADSMIFELMREHQLNLPQGTAQLPGTNVRAPFFFVGDDAFPLSTTMMKPYSGRGLTEVKKIFNYRLSRARRVIENAFGIMASRWRVFRKPIAMHPDSVDKVILAAICLHNFLKTRDEALAPARRLYCPPNFVDREGRNGIVQLGRWREEDNHYLLQLPAAPNNNFPINAVGLRNSLADYFMTPEGAVPWQFDHIHYRAIAEE